MPPVDDDDDFFTLPTTSRPRAAPPQRSISVDDDDDAFDLMPPLRTPAILREEAAPAAHGEDDGEDELPAADEERCVLTFREALLLVAGQKPELQVRVLEALTDLETARATLATVGDAVESCLVSARVGDEKQAEADAGSESESGVSM